MSSEKKGTSNLLTTPVGNDEDDSMKLGKFDTIMDPDDNTIDDDSKTEEIPPQSMKPRRSIRNECPRIKGLQSKGNFFNKTLHYKIHLPSVKTEIYRQYSDFEWLHKKLLNRYGSTSGSFVPALPNKISLKGINKEQISDHCKLMQEWIIDVCFNNIT